jgi:hypothetical protein
MKFETFLNCNIFVIQRNRTDPDNIGTNETIARPASTGLNVVAEVQTNCKSISSSLEGCCPANGFQCGRAFSPLPGSKNISARAQFGEFPWQAILFSSQSIYIGSAVLVDQRHLIGVAHRLQNYV